MELVTGFMLPKITTSDVLEYMNSMEVINSEHRFNIYALPILESSYIIHNETRDIELRKIKTLLDSYRRLVLNVRIGATDFSSLFALRRTSSRPIYDIGVVANCIYDIINHFGRQGGYVISGPVWEYFKSGERLLKPQLRQTPFVDRLGESGVELRGELIHDVKDGIIMETLLDLENGLIGKTIIHPSHINIVQSLHVVTHEMYSDALRIVSENNGDAGVCSSEYNNKMNEIKPHLAWANKILKRADIYGVYNRNKSYIDLLEVE